MTPKPITRLTGTLCLPKEHFSDELWLMEPFSRGQAWLDLWYRANDRRRLLVIRGVSVPVERGQTAWSIERLAEEWHWCRQKVRAFLAELQDRRKILLKTSNVTTIITVIDYTVYNPDSTPELPIDLTPEQAAECDTEQTAEPTPEQTAEYEAHRIAECKQKIGRGEEGRSEGERLEGEPRPGAMIPSDEEVGSFCQSWPGDLARAIPGSIPQLWWTGWLASKLGSGNVFPREWRRVLVLSFVSDWLNGHPKARAGSTFPDNSRAENPEGKKNGAGMSAAQARFQWGKELEELEAQMDAGHALDQPPNARQASRVQALREKIAGLPE